MPVLGTSREDDGSTITSQAAWRLSNVDPERITAPTLDESMLLRSATVMPGEVMQRVIRGPKIVRSTSFQMISCCGAHILVGVLQYTCWGKCDMPRPGSQDACFRLPGEHADGGISLTREVFIDATLTALFLSALQWFVRFRDVRLGLLPYVSPRAFPRGCALRLAFPNWCDCLDGDAPTRTDCAAHLRTLVALAVLWGLLWGGLTLCLLLLVCVLPMAGPTGAPLCLSPWTYISVRAAWTELEALLVSVGSFVFWCSRAADPRPAGRHFQPQPHSGAHPGLIAETSTKRLTPLRQPLTPAHALDFRPVD